ncbi:unnamed protein product [Brassica rapa subsp. trilocularis]
MSLERLFPVNNLESTSRETEEWRKGWLLRSLWDVELSFQTGGEVGAAQHLQRGKEHVMMFNYSWKREGIQVSAFFYRCVAFVFKIKNGLSI